MRNNFFKRNPGGPFDVRYVYVMVQTPLPIRCKIGISTRPDLRQKQITRRVRVVCKAKVWGAEYFERMLHFFFRPFHAPVRGDGGTEFFWTIPVLFIAPVLLLLLWCAQRSVGVIALLFFLYILSH